MNNFSYPNIGLVFTSECDEIKTMIVEFHYENFLSAVT
jgi:hypothetical protein